MKKNKHKITKVEGVRVKTPLGFTWSLTPNYKKNTLILQVKEAELQNYLFVSKYVYIIYAHFIDQRKF